MDQKLIVQTLKSACGNKNFRFQVIIQNAKLHIYINHKAEALPDYAFLTKLVVQAISPLSLAEFKGAWLYSRQLGAIEPNWETYIEFPLEVEVNKMDIIGNSYTQSTGNKNQNPHNAEVDSIANAGFISQASTTNKVAPNKEEVNDYVELVDESESFESPYGDFDLVEFGEQDSSGDTGLLNDTGMVHKAALEEEEINTFVSSLLGDNSIGSDTVEQKSGVEINAGDFPLNSSPLNLAQYCFVSNKKMLTEDIIPPDKETIRLVKLFHHLSDNNKEKILPILDDYFKLAKIPDLENFSMAGQKWFKQIIELDDDHRHTAEIWLSRYCFDSSVTLEEFKDETARSAAIAAKKKKNYKSEYDLTPANISKQNASDSNVGTELKSDKLTILSIIQRSILPLIWTMATVVMIILGMNTNSFLLGFQNNPPLCDSTIGSPDYCRLSINLVGENKIRQLTPDAVPLTKTNEKEAKLGCQRYANFKANIADADLLTTSVLSSYGNKVFPHVYVVEASQTNIQNDQEVKVGCVYITGNSERAPLTVNAEVIPDDFSQGTSQTKQKKSNISFGSYTNAINLGLYTIFTAIGLVIVSKLRLGIEIRKLQTIYLVALAVAILQSLAVVILQSFVGVNLLAGIILPGIILPIITMVTMSIILKDFKLKRNSGYLLTVIGIFTVIAIQFLLYGLFQILINSLV